MHYRARDPLNLFAVPLFSLSLARKPEVNWNAWMMRALFSFLPPAPHSPPPPAHLIHRPNLTCSLFGLIKPAWLPTISLFYVLASVLPTRYQDFRLLCGRKNVSDCFYAVLSKSPFSVFVCVRENVVNCGRSFLALVVFSAPQTVIIIGIDWRWPSWSICHLMTMYLTAVSIVYMSGLPATHV